MRGRDWDPEDIKAAVRKQGVTLAQLGRPHGLTRQAMANALIKPSAQAEAVIAEAIGTQAHLIWPSRYNSDGQRKRPQPPSNYTRRPRFALELRA